MKRVLLSLILILLTHLTAFSQTAIIHGKVFDSTSQSSIEGADVFLFAGESNKTFLKTRTSNRGFTFRQLPEGNYQLVIAAVSFKNDTTLLTIKRDDSLQLTINLTPLENMLDGVVVKATPKPISVKGDTLTFHTDAFAVRPNAQMEDVLRKYPGVDVDKDGNITVQGQKVDKITLNGKDFFLGDIKNANSLPAEMIASIETFSTQSERARFSGVKENSETRTLNIKTKKGMDQAWIGNLYASKGQRESYAAGGQVTKLGSDLMVNGTLKTNNINNRFLGVESKNMGPQTGIQSTNGFDLNFTKKWGDKVNAALSINNNDQKTEVLQSTGRRTFFTDSSLQENRQGQSITSNKSLPVNFMITYNSDSMNQWQFNTGISVTSSTSNNQDTAAIQTLYNNGSGYHSSRAQTRNENRQHSFGINNQLEWRHRFYKTGRTLQWSVSQSTQNGNSPGSLFSILNSYAPTGSLLQQTVNNQQFTQSNKGSGYGSSVMYTEPLFAQHNLSFIYSFNTQLQQSDKKSYDYDSVAGDYTTPNPLTTNRFNNRSTIHRVESSFGRTTQAFNYQMGMGWQYSILDNLNFSPDRHINQHFTNLFPRATANFVLGKGKNLGINYYGSSNAPTIEQLQPLPDITNPLLIKSGNPNLKQSFNHSVSANIRSFNMKSFSGIMLAVNGDVVRNQIVSSTTLLSGGVQEQQFVNVNGTYHMGTNASYSFRLGGKKGSKNNGSISTRLRYGHDVGLINGAENVTNSLTWGQSMKINYSIDTKFIAELMGGTDYSSYRYSISPQQNTRSWNHNATLNMSYEMPFGINMQASFMWTHLGTSGLLPSQTNKILNAAIYKRLFASQQWQIRLSGFDLFNTNRNYSQSAAQNYISTRQTNQLQRMFLLSLVYDFKTFAGIKKAGDNGK